MSKYRVELNEQYEVEADNYDEAIDRAVAASHGGRITGVLRLSRNHSAWEAPHERTA